MMTHFSLAIVVVVVDGDGDGDVLDYGLQQKILSTDIYSVGIIFFFISDFQSIFIAYNKSRNNNNNNNKFISNRIYDEAFPV